ncbi:Rv0909 family putative TA system antitoxin [Cellulomonas carbonis]|nr:Rv0909 family putative TA system antitoxin [Cellulomonas carbonis]GGC00847.1 hypothetical protein GCM10010972_12050 [Cellulomonas carbonis]
MGLDDMKEKASDAGIEKAGDTAEGRLGDQHADTIDKAEDQADRRIGQ